jgi:hypothetical protein
MYFFVDSRIVLPPAEAGSAQMLAALPRLATEATIFRSLRELDGSWPSGASMEHSAPSISAILPHERQPDGGHCKCEQKPENEAFNPNGSFP